MTYPAGSLLVCPECERPLAELVVDLEPGTVLQVSHLARREAAKPLAAGGTLDCPDHGPMPNLGRAIVRPPG